MNARTLLSLFRQHKGRCFYCGCATWSPDLETKAAARERFGIVFGAPRSAKALTYRRATIEHLVRVVDGGTDHRRNLTLACAYCNHRRGDTPVEVHGAAMQIAMTAGQHPNAPSFDPSASRKAMKRTIAGLIAERTHAPA